jgi:hypothetical protein
VNYQSIARRYLPLAAVVAVQLLIIAVVPSKADTSSATSVAAGPVQGYSTGGAATSSGSSGVPVGGSAESGAGTGGPAVGGGVAGPGTSTVGGGSSAGTVINGGNGSTASTPGAPGSGSSSGTGSATIAANTSHCSGSREFSPSIDFYAPPCTPGPVAATSYPNGGATYQGVTANSVTIVDYVSDYGAEVNTILQAEGLLETYPDAQTVDTAWQNFINSHYVLWGRHLIIKTYQGQCQSVPPDYSCLLAEMDSVVQTYHPYAVFWNTTLCSACFARLAADHVVAIGGVGFSDAFTDANAPYFYSPFESSTHMDQAFASWWCGQMTSVGSSRVVTYAQDKNPAQNFNGQKRVLGIISTNDPDNEDTVNKVLVPLLKSDCGETVSHFYFYSQDINTAAQQTSAGISAMDTSPDPATDVLCLCDPVAPEFLYEGEEQHNYWPENILADVQGMGYDSTGQNYEAGSNDSPSLPCPAPSVGCEYDNAFGLLAESPQEPQNNNAGVRTFTMGGGSKLPISGQEADEVWSDYEMLASLIENTGPDLTPARMQAAAPSMGSIGGGTTGHYEVGFSSGNYNWTQDAEVAYWDKAVPSSYNGSPGAYIPIEGRRFLPGQYPTVASPPVPASRP